MKRTLARGLLLSVVIGLGCLALAQVHRDDPAKQAPIGERNAEATRPRAQEQPPQQQPPRLNPFRQLHERPALEVHAQSEQEVPQMEAASIAGQAIATPRSEVQRAAHDVDAVDVELPRTPSTPAADPFGVPFTALNPFQGDADAEGDPHIAIPLDAQDIEVGESTPKTALPPSAEAADAFSEVSEGEAPRDTASVTTGDRDDAVDVDRNVRQRPVSQPERHRPEKIRRLEPGDALVPSPGESPPTADRATTTPIPGRPASTGPTPLPDHVAAPPPWEDEPGAPRAFDGSSTEDWDHQESYDYPTAGTGVPGDKSLEGPQSPTLMIQKIVPPEIQLGKETQWDIVVRNVGKTAVEKVEVHDLVPRGTRLISTTPLSTTGPNGELSWSFDRLRPGEEIALQIRLVPLEEGEIGSVATFRFAGMASARSVVTRPELKVRVSGPKSIMLGEQVTLSIEVSNAGTGKAEGVLLQESIPEQFEHPAGRDLELSLGTLKPGESVRKELTLKAIRPGLSVNVLTALADGELQAEDRIEMEVMAPDLELSVDGPSVRYLETKTRLDIVLANPGTAPAKDVRMTAKLSKGIKFISANNAGRYDPRTHTVYWNLVELPAQRAGNVALVVEPLEMGSELVRIEATAQKGLADAVEKPIQVEGLAALLFTVADVEDPIEVGGRTTYEVRVVNQGSKEATAIKLVAEFPPQMKPLAASGPVAYRISGQQIIFEPLATLSAKADTTYKVQGEALQAGDLRIKVLLESAELEAPVTKEESTRAYSLK